ncbi:MAG: hypothetical protein NT001_03850 [Candidatus Woesearchaeota archaeon]|nr:hypothetical protein [Candidatus Woesearchaeota archaeon]
MAKKRKSAHNGLKSALSGSITSILVHQLKAYMKDIARQVQDIAYQTEKKILDNLFASIILLVGLIMIVIAIVFFINDFFGLDRYWGFFIVGLVLIIISLLYKRKIDNTKYYNFER